MSAIKKEDASMTSQEMLDRSCSWTLACDNALLNRLKKFSEDLTRNSQDILRECDTLSRDVKQLDYRLINVSNEFLMLSNTQFVENRVEEFKEFSSPVSSANTTATVKTKAEQEAALVSKMKQAIQLGFTACNERRQANVTPVNRFKRKQPYLIGSPKFFSSKYCGLVDESLRRSRTYQESLDLDSVSISQMSDTYDPPTPTQAKHEVKFTMPPTPVFPVKVPDHDKPVIANDNHVIANEGRKGFGIPDLPPSPSISNRSSERGTGSGSSISKGNLMPRSVTDELNKIYGSFAPPPTADDDSEDDFRPNTGVGRIFDDDDDDIFQEKDFFPSNQKSDFFGRSNPSQLPTPVFFVPPPVNPVPQSKPTTSCVQTLVGHEPKTNDIPNKSSVTGNISKKDVLIRDPTPETEGSFRPKLPPGAVSPFGNLPPPVFNNGTRQEAQTANTDVPHVSKPDTQISSNSTAEVASVFAAGAATASAISRDITTTSSHVHEDVNRKYVTSQPSHNVAAPGRTEIISQGSLSGSGNIQSKAKAKPAPTVPVNSLFADESSDEDIFLSSKKQKTVNAFQPPKVVPNINAPITSTLNKNTVSDKIPTISSKLVKKPTPIKKSIFDDSESEDDLFTSRPSTSRSENKKVVDNGNIFKSEPKKLSVPVVKVNKKSLFSDDSDSDSDLFGNKKTVQQIKVITKSSVAPAKMEDTKVDTVWDEDDDLFKDTTQQQKARETSPLKSNLFNNNNEVEEAVTKETQVIKSNSNVSITTTKPAVEKETKEKPAAVKKSIFDDDSESDDDLFSSKSSSNVVASKSESASSLDFKSTVPVTNSSKGKPASLFDDDSDSDSDLFGAKSKKNNTEREKLVNSSKDKIENDLTSNKVNNIDEVDATLPLSKQNKELTIFADENKDNDKSQDEPKPTKVTGTKISEKIKAMQNAKTSESTESVVSAKKSIKSKVSVKSLALNLNINPLAMMVGAKPPKTGASTPSTPDREFSDQSPINEASYTLSLPGQSNKNDIAKKNDENSNQEKDDSVGTENKDSIQEQGNTPCHGINDLVGILKARVKIQRKRRPPTRNFLKSLAIHKQDEENEKDEEKSQEEELNKEDNQKEASDSDNKKGKGNDEVDKEMEESD